MNQEKLKSVLTYCTETGCFYWAKNISNRIKKGDAAGSILISKSNKYIAIKISNKSYKAHRLAWLYCFGCFPVFEIDHINGNGLDNRLSNLRDVTRQENAKNRRRYYTNSSGVPGVHWVKSRDRWKARISVDGKRVTIGSYKVFSEAVTARHEAEIKYNYHPNHGKR